MIKKRGPRKGNKHATGKRGKQPRRKSPHGPHETFRRTLESAASEWFEGAGVATTRTPGYIEKQTPLAGQQPGNKLTTKNLLSDDVRDVVWAQFDARGDGGFALHKWLHNGLSSQAMLFNLVGTLMAAGKLDAMRAAFTDAGVKWPAGELSAEFEVEDPALFNEVQTQPTSMDLVLSGEPDDAPIFIEAKLVELGFGGCSMFADSKCDGANPTLPAADDDFGGCPLVSEHKRRYWEHLQGLGVLQAATMQGPVCGMARHYQFYRELVFARSPQNRFGTAGHLVLLVDARNPNFRFIDEEGTARGWWPELTAALPDAHRPWVHYVSIQSLVRAVFEAGDGDLLAEFAKKYALSPDTDTLADAPTPGAGRFAFDQHVLGSLRSHLRRGIQAPGKATWTLRRDEGCDVIEVGVTHDLLAGQLQMAATASPTYAICFAYWLADHTGVPARVEVTVLGHLIAAPADGQAPSSKWLHWHRSIMLLRAWELIFAGRFTVKGEVGACWPETPRMNLAKSERPMTPSKRKRPGSEHDLEVKFASEDAFAAFDRAFADEYGAVSHIGRQLPVGLFDGAVTNQTRWTPGGASQVDAWAISQTDDGATTAHVFELKIEGNVEVGIVPEALYYGWLLRHLGEGPPHGPRVEAGPEASGEPGALDDLKRISEANRLVVWLAAPELHPLVQPTTRHGLDANREAKSPLAWFNEGLHQFGMCVRVLPVRPKLAVEEVMVVAEAWPSLP